MLTYEITVTGKWPTDPKTVLTIKAKSLDNLRKRILDEFLTPVNVVEVRKVRDDMSTRYIGAVMGLNNPIWMTDRGGMRQIHMIDPKTGKISRGY